MEEKIKPAGNPKNGWQLRDRFVDDAGSLFSRGKFVRKLSPEELTESGESNKTVEVFENQVTGQKADIAQAEKKSVKQNQEDTVEVSRNLLETLLKRIDQIENKTSIGREPTSNKSELSELITIIKSDGATERSFDTDEIDPDDIVEEGVIFTSVGTGFLITDDRRFNKTIKIPGGKPFIKFRYAATKINTNNRKEDEILTYCTYISYSKKEIEFLRNHTLMDIAFFENNPKKAMSRSAKFIQLASNVHNQISGLDKMKLISKAKNMGITGAMDIKTLRSEIAAKVAEEQVNRESNRSAVAANEEWEKDVFLK